MFKNKWFVLLAFFLLLSVIAFRFVVPSWVARDKNRVELLPPYKVSLETIKVYQSLTVADLHADTLLWGRNILKRSSSGHIDLPRLFDANVTLQVFSVVTKTPKGLNIKSNDDKTDNITLLALAQGWPWKSLDSLYERALYQAKRLQYFADISDGQLKIIRSKQDLESVIESRKNNRSVVAALLSIEGAHAIEGNPDNLDKLYEAGYRIIGLTHFFDNEIGGSAHGLEKKGLTDFGRKIIMQAQAKNMFIDISHASSMLITDVLEISTKPVLVSHTGVKGTCDRSRNLTDDQIRAVAATGGLIGIGVRRQNLLDR
jgi:microsomal dipeptidase-like Zn-dependent dipeptidase